MSQAKDYSIYQELDLSLEQIKRQLPRVAQAANSRLAQTGKNSRARPVEYGSVKEFFASQWQIKRSLFERRKAVGCIHSARMGYHDRFSECTRNNA